MGLFRIKLALVSISLAAALTPIKSEAHRMTYAPPDRKDDVTTTVGVIGFELENADTVRASFQIEVLDEGREPIPDDHWRTNVEHDLIELEPGERADWLLQVRHPGKYLACTRRVGTGLVTRICATLNRPF